MINTQRALLVATTILGLIVVQTLAFADGANWPQWGQNAQHTGTSTVAAQSLQGLVAETQFDPFVDAEAASQDGDLLVHYQAPLVDGQDVFMAFKTSADGLFDPNNWNHQSWGERRFHWENGALVTKWSWLSDYKLVPQVEAFVGWEPVFHGALVGNFLYAPGAGGGIWKLDRGTGAVVAHITAFGGGDPYPANAFVASPLAADGGGNVYYTIIQFDLAAPWTTDVVDSFLVKVRPDDTNAKASYRDLVPGAPGAADLCYRAFITGVDKFPWPPSPDAVPTQGACGSQRPGLNVTPAIATDGTIYTVSRAHRRDRYSFLVATNPDLTPKWAASFRDRLSDGCGVVLWMKPQNGGCANGTTVGVDPATNQPPAGRVIDQSTSSPTIAPDGSVIYGTYSRYNYAQGHFLKFSSTGAFQAAYSFGWDTTPAVYSHGGSYSFVIKDNHYEAGSYCNDPKWCPPDRTASNPRSPEAYFITQLSSSLNPEWMWQNTNTQSCMRNPDGSVSCVSDHPHGFEWCINAPAVDANGVVYANSEDGNIYSIKDGVRLQALLLRLAIGAAYTPLAIGPDGLIYTENDGAMFVVGIGNRIPNAGGGSTTASATRRIPAD
jgi:hypothetical protein